MVECLYKYYIIGENNLRLLDTPKYGYDIALNQDITTSGKVINNVVQFPYTFLEKNTLVCCSPRI